MATRIADDEGAFEPAGVPFEAELHHRRTGRVADRIAVDQHPSFERYRMERHVVEQIVRDNPQKVAGRSQRLRPALQHGCEELKEKRLQLDVLWLPPLIPMRRPA